MTYTLPQCIEHAAEVYAEKEAFRCGQRSFTYMDLNYKMKQLAKFLIDSGLSKGDRVGVFMNRCLETSVAIYGIMEAGGIFVPMDPLVPVARSLFLIEDCSLRQMVTIPSMERYIRPLLRQESTLELIIGLSKAGNLKSASWEAIYSQSLENYSPANILEQDLAYIMYSSGSTGFPKGIMHTHYSGLSYARLSAELYGVSSEDRIANHAPLFFDISTFGYFTAPLMGATTVIIPEAYTKLPASLAELMEKEQLSIWYSVPLALVQLLLHGLLEERNLSSIRWVLFGGEHFAPKYLARLMELWPNARFSNVYGPAEVNQCTYYHLEDIPKPDTRIPIGKVWGNTDYKILGEGDAEVANGQAGELLIRSATMMRGYWNNPKLNKKAWFTTIDQAGQPLLFYRTGDLVKTSKKGELMLLGRNDSQVKVRGYRIELEEVENTLKRHSMVQDAVAVMVNTVKEVQEVWGAVLPLQGRKLAIDDLRQHCRRWLPPYAIPEKIVKMSEFPRTGSEKIDRMRIKEIFGKHEDGKSDLNIY